jgi:SAM-dependent methyltransferase
MSLPPHDPLLNVRRTGYTRSGFGARYHAHRPKPPAALVDVLLQHASANVSFKAGVAQQTGIPDGAADIVTCAQSLHHTEPAGTMAEIGRILRPGGVFAAYDYDWPPMVHWETNQAFAVSDGELGLTALRDVAERMLGADGLPWYVSYHVRAAVR